MDLRRAVSLAAVVAVALGVATGLSHVGHSTASKCTGTWLVVVGHSVDRINAATVNSRAAALAPTLCPTAVADPKGGYFAVATFTNQTDANTYLQQLVSAGYVKQWKVQPFVQAPTG